MQSKSHLPPLQGGRWTTRRKAALVEAIANGGITLEEACERYQLSPEEFACWVEAVKQHGTPWLAGDAIPDLSRSQKERC